MKIAYKNVCSIRDAQVEFKPGQLICICGESNQGKSAMFYSLESGLTNTPDFKRFINNEALKENPKATAWIGLTDDEGNLWQIEAGTGHFYYRANDIKYEKTNRKSLFELINGQIPGLLYDPDNTCPIMNIVGEDSGFFPIDRSDAQIFKTYERLLSLSCTEDILRTIKLDQDDIDYKTGELLKSIQKDTEYLTAYSKLQETVKIEDVTKLYNDFLALKNLNAQFIDTYSQTNKIALYSKVVEEFNIEQPELFNIAGFQEKLSTLVKANQVSKYIELSKVEFEKEEFDLSKAIELGQDFSVAYQLSQEIAQLNNDIATDEKTFLDIKSKLDNIETCPLCGQPMGVDHDKTIHSI